MVIGKSNPQLRPTLEFWARLGTPWLFFSEATSGFPWSHPKVLGFFPGYCSTGHFLPLAHSGQVRAWGLGWGRGGCCRSATAGHLRLLHCTLTSGCPWRPALVTRSGGSFKVRKARLSSTRLPGQGWSGPQKLLEALSYQSRSWLTLPDTQECSNLIKLGCT